MDDTTGDPLVGAHVFIASSMVGTITDAEGAYRIENAPAGALRLHVSIIGFHPVTRNLFTDDKKELKEDFYLKPRVFELGSITVEAGRNKQWERQLRRFTKLFIGETANARHTKILNPEVLSFEHNARRFSALANEPLLIENNALGYRLRYFLIEFSAMGDLVQYQGEPLFEEVTPATPDQNRQWMTNRSTAFNGSFQHFLLSLVDDRFPVQEFKIYQGRFLKNGQFKRKYEANPNELLSTTNSAFIKMLDFEDVVELTYLGEEEEQAYLQWINKPFAQPGLQTSWLELTEGPTAIDMKGELLNPYSITMSGYLGFGRIADSLPKEYRPGHVN